MRHTRKLALWSITGLLFASIGLAEEYDYELGIAGRDNLGFEGFASWFVSPNVRLSARYRVDDVDYPGDLSIGGTSTSSADQDSFGIGATVRF